MSRYGFVVGLVVVVAVGVSCKDDPPLPVMNNPAGLAAHAAQFREAIGTPAMQSLGALGPALAAFGVDVASLALPGMQGQTLEWNTTTDVLDSTARAGAPANATRVILYSINSSTHLPVEPLVEVGYVDLFAHSDFPDSASIRYLVTDSSAAPVVLADFIAYTNTALAGLPRVQGFVTNGTRRLDFTYPYDPETGDARTLTGTDWNMVNPASTVTHRSLISTNVDSTFGSELVLDFDGQEILSVSILTGEPGVPTTGSQDLGVGDSHEFFGRVTVNAGSLSGAGPDGRPLTTDEFNAANQLRGLSVELALNVHRAVLLTFFCGGC